MPGEAAVLLPGGVLAPACQVALVMEELERVRHALEDLAGTQLDDAALSEGIRTANSIRLRLFRLRQLVYRAEPRPLPALEMLIAEMLALHFCSDRSECAAVLDDLLEETERRVQKGIGALPGATRIFWINPVADLRAMNLLEACGARLCGTEWMFCHALDPLPEDCPPLEALARTALADPMVGDAVDRADRVCRDAAMAGAEAVVISRIPGASHCATEGQVICETVRERLGLPVIELEVPPVSDALEPALRTRLEALVETAQHQRSKAKRHFASPSTEV
jgi:benzoyl-CoA reductase/2-hydroxyglutaryl-CoA dehydratase subunit BcrC/BadD/HgdB